jgi:hypothetical protein
MTARVGSQEPEKVAEVSNDDQVPIIPENETEEKVEGKKQSNGLMVRMA